VGTDFVELRGSAREAGRLAGRLAADAITERLAAVREAERRAGVAEDELAERAKEFASHLERHAPHWLDEAAGLAEGAGVAAGDVLALNCLPASLYTPGDECTSFVGVKADRAVLFKIRDYRPCVQVLLTLAVDGWPPMQISREVGGLGAAHAISGRAVAGACNTGSASDRVADHPRLNDCHMVRWICERAERVADVPRLAAELIDARAAGGAGGDRGSILLFAGGDGGGILETVNDDLEWTEVTSGAVVASNHFVSERARSWESRPPDENTLVRKRRMEELLGASGPTDAARIFAMSRDRETAPHALCNYDTERPVTTVSAALHVIDREDPSRSLAHVCCGNTRHSFFLPVPLAETRSFVPLASGEFCKLADGHCRAHGDSAPLSGGRERIEGDGVSFEQAARGAFGILARDGR